MTDKSDGEKRAFRERAAMLKWEAMLKWAAGKKWGGDVDATIVSHLAEIEAIIQSEVKDKRRRHPHHALSARRVKALSAPGRYGDGGGLYLLVSPSGAKSWVLRTVVRRTRRDIGLGGASLVSLAEAREQARLLRKIAREGGDPLSERRRRVVPSFEAAARSVHAAHAASFKNAKHRKRR